MLLVCTSLLGMPAALMPAITRLIRSAFWLIAVLLLGSLVNTLADRLAVSGVRLLSPSVEMLSKVASLGRLQLEES